MAVVNIPENPSQLQSTEEHQTSPFFEDFSFVKLLGKGAFGCVCMALKKKEKKHFAVKCIELEEENVQLGNREVKVLSGLKHCNIVSYYNAWWEKNPPLQWEERKDEYSDTSSFDSRDIKKKKKLYENVTESTTSSDQPSAVKSLSNASSDQSFVKKSPNFIYLYIQMELCREENLAQWLKTREPVELNGNQIIWEILSAVKYLHRQKLVHRDLSPNNIFFGLNGSAKLGDFGSAKEVDESFQATISEGLQDPQSKQVSVTGTDPYIAPELLNSSSYNHKVDVYSLGIILFEIIMGPFKTDSERSSHITKLKSSQTPPELQDIIKNLLLSMVSVVPDKRPEVEHILLKHFPKVVKQPNPRPIKREISCQSGIVSVNTRDFGWSKKIILCVRFPTIDSERKHNPHQSKRTSRCIGTIHLNHEKFTSLLSRQI